MNKHDRNMHCFGINCTKCLPTSCQIGAGLWKIIIMNFTRFWHDTSQVCCMTLQDAGIVHLTSVLQDSGSIIQVCCQNLPLSCKSNAGFT